MPMPMPMAKASSPIRTAPAVCEPARGRWKAVPAWGQWPAEQEEVPTMVAKRISRPRRSLSRRCLKLIPPASSASHAVAPVISLAAERLDLKPPLRTPGPGDLVRELGEHPRPFSSSLVYFHPVDIFLVEPMPTAAMATTVTSCMHSRPSCTIRSRAACTRFLSNTSCCSSVAALLLATLPLLLVSN